jgi:hypothetical protein
MNIQLRCDVDFVRLNENWPGVEAARTRDRSATHYMGRRAIMDSRAPKVRSQTAHTDRIISISELRLPPVS